MGQLPQRARKAEDKEERRRAIVAAGRALLEEAPFAEVTMAAVAQRAALAKGTVFLYFPTKEALCLEVLDTLIGEWFDALDAELEKPGRFTQARLVRTMVCSIEHRHLLARLMAIVSGVLERNVELERIIAFKSRLLGRIVKSGAVLERRLELAEGEGARLFLRLNALVVGLYQACDLGPMTRAALERPELAALRVDFDTELPILLSALVTGLLTRESA
jgi:AcrR family transcriptional regulator